MPSWLSGDGTALVRRDTNIGGSSPSLGTKKPTSNCRFFFDILAVFVIIEYS